ncbi:winged helix-turn-helix domain-containing protein [Sphingomonas crusticola]|uniref:winged helix-turn-helix domain-containing protein n=1 Tax=Sphingomonas crusticola TaxID=1697973 RepID=UPI0013C3549A|nr:winged helix-turn-helix domain-containing protein [Sphingomonas crusticola]
MNGGASFTIGAFRVDPGRNLVVTPTGEISLEPKIMDVLQLLADHPGEVLSRETIIDTVWGRSFGTDESLTRAISQLRKVFGDSRSPPAVIETIPKRGYRLVASVSFPPRAPGTRSRQSGPSTSRPGRLRWLLVAVILIAAIGAGIAYHGRPADVVTSAQDGIAVAIHPLEAANPSSPIAARTVTEQVAVALSRAPLLRVRRSGDQASGARPAYAVRGSVQPLGAGSRVTIEIFDPQSHESLWAGNFDRPQRLSIAAQDELIGAIAGELENRLLGLAKTAIRRKPFATLRPWELTLLATWVPGSDEVFLVPHKADATLPQRRALQLDPNYAPAHASLAQALAYYAMFTPGAPVAQMRQEAARHARVARGLAPYDPGVLYQLANYHRMIGDRPAAAATLRRVLALQPDHPLAQLDLTFVEGLCAPRGDASVTSLRQAIARLSPDNPVRPTALSHLADVQLGRGDYAGAADAAARSHEIVHQTWSGMTLAAALAQQGQDEAAVRISRQTKLEWPGLDWTRFAKYMARSWCMGGRDQANAAKAFRKLGALDLAPVR